MRQWVLIGMKVFRVSEAIRAYQEAEVDLRGAAERAGLPVAVFFHLGHFLGLFLAHCLAQKLEEMAARKVAVLDGPDDFGPGLEALRRAWPRDE